MTQATVTGGSIQFEDAVKHSLDTDGKYGVTRRAIVTLAFDVGEGADESAQLTRVSDLARAKVSYLLGNGKTPAAASADNAAVVTDPQTPAADAPKTRKRRTAAEIAADEAAAKAATVVADPKTSSASADAASIGSPVETPGPSGTSDQSASGSVDASDMSAFDVPAGGVLEVISDAELNDAVMKKNGELKDPPKIRALIATYNPDPTKAFALAQVAPASRQEFLDKLAALA